MGLERWAGAVRKKYRAGDRVRLSRKALAARVGSAKTRDAVGTVTKVDRSEISGWTYFVTVKWDKLSVPQTYAAAFVTNSTD
jgi:hypothetical protein